MHRILLIDDAPFAREPLARLLRHVGYDTTVARNGVEALLAVESCEPHLILLDVMMPKLDGVGFLRALRASDRGRHLPVILLTGTLDTSRLARAKEQQIQGVVHKEKFDIDDLIARIRALVG